MFTGALLISSGFTLNITVCAMLVVKRGEGYEIPIDMTPKQRRKSLFQSWSGYYFQNEEYCIDEDEYKREFFWNIKELVSVDACPVDYDDYKINANNTITTKIDETKKKDTTKNSSINDGIVLTVEGINNEAYESSTDNLENGHYLQFEIPKPKTDNDTVEISTDNSENPHFLQFEMTKTKTDNEDFEVSKDNSENPHFLQFEITKPTSNNETYETSKDNSENDHYLKFEMPKPKINGDVEKEKIEDINKNKNIVQNGINTKSANSGSKKVRITARRGSRVKKTVKEKLKLLYTNVSFILLLISFSLFLFGTSVVFTHILPYAESESVSSSIGLLLVSVLGGAGLAGRIGLGAIAQLPRVNPIVLYIIAVLLCGMYSYYSSQIKIQDSFSLLEIFLT